MRDCLAAEVHYRTSRASGPGGQHVNKTESRVELVWNLELSRCISAAQKERLRNRLPHRINSRGELSMASEHYRSQFRNREEVFQRFLVLLETALLPTKRRIPTRASLASKEKRIRNKKLRGEIKHNRQKPRRED